MWIYDYQSQRDNPYRQEPFVEIVHMSHIDNLPQWRYPWHAHSDAYELAFILRGSGRLVINEQSLPVKTGSITIVPPGVSHHFAGDEGTEMQYYTLRFRAQPEGGELQRFFAGLGNAVTSGANCLSYVQDSFQLLLSIHYANGGVADRTFQSVCLGLLQLTRTLFTNEAMTLQLSSRYSMSDVLEYIQRNRGEKITLDSLSRKFNISVSHLSRIFKKAYNMSPIDYLIYCRTTYATEYLLKSDLSVAEIAELVGYDNPTHFSNMFLKKVGCTPTEYRERNRRQPMG